jgi:hypothetical protein
LNVPGSLSSALQQTYVGLSASLGTNPHFIPVENPAPPRPRSPDALTTSITWAGGIERAFFKPS